MQFVCPILDLATHQAALQGLAHTHLILGVHPGVADQELVDQVAGLGVARSLAVGDRALELLDLFGDRRVGTNYPYVFLSYGLGGIAGPLLGGWMRDLGSRSGDVTTWAWAFVIAGVACLLGALVMMFLRAPKTSGKPAVAEGRTLQGAA